MWPKRRDDTAPQEVYVETCPKCGSRRVRHRMGLTPFVIMGIFYVYECADCGYKGVNVDIKKVEWSPPPGQEEK
ncbi:MAG: hypothetical protein HPY73_06265 [Methanomassiliicoccales archaeon]|nr:MAG: hypothetical protein HPY73_06265 [Methanomassiliicoccales archaeon]